MIGKIDREMRLKRLVIDVLADKFGVRVKKIRSNWGRYSEIYKKCLPNTMVGGDGFKTNLQLVDTCRHLEGDVVECGVWKGGMSAGMAYLLGPTRKYYLFDSFEGLPKPTEMDGEYAVEWQESGDDELTHSNCTADEADADAIMRRTGVDYQLVKGWFQDTVPNFEGIEKIAVLRLDGDWYDSTMIALEKFVPLVVPGGVIILDDYYYWEGCSKAVHDYLSREKSTARLVSGENFAYFRKQAPGSASGARTAESAL